MIHCSFFLFKKNSHHRGFRKNSQAVVRTFLTATFLFFCTSVFSQANKKSELQSQIQKLNKGFDGKMGVAAVGLDFKDSLLYNDTIHYPMQSVYKVPLAIYILDRVDRGILRIDQPVRIVKSKLDQETWSPLLKDFRQDTLDLTVAELLRYSVSKSDNNACDLLFELAGGTKPVHAFFQTAGITQMAIAATEAEMHANWDVQYTNWCRPSAMLQVLSGLYKGRWLKPESNSLLMQLMTESENAPNRIKGLLPKDAVVAHKTGTGNVNKQGIRSATNDVGIITLPNGRHYALVVYLSDFKDDMEKSAKLIADISKIIWDYYTH